MKKVLPVLACVILSLNLWAQDDKAAIQSVLDNYYTAVVNNDVDQVRSLLPPEIYTKIDKPKYDYKYKGNLEGKTLKLLTTYVGDGVISEIVEDEEGQYALVECRINSELWMEVKPGDEKREKLWEMTSSYFDPANYEDRAKVDKGVYTSKIDNETHTVYMQGVRKLLLVKKPGYDDWKVVKYAKYDKKLLKKAFPKSLVKNMEEEFVMN